MFDTTIGKMIMTFLISMVPVVELRGAIPYGVGLGLDWWIATPLAMIGNLIPVPFIIFFIKKIFAWMRKLGPRFDKLVTKLEKRAEKKAPTVQKYAFWGLFIFVAIPLPGTGAWTGALIAAMLDMRLKRAFPSIALGVFTAGVVISVLTYVLKVTVF